MHRIYPYRTTYDKLDDGTAARHIQEAGDSIVTAHFLGGRDWVLICRHGEATVADLTATELEDLITRSVRAAVTTSHSALTEVARLSREDLRTREAGL